MYSGRASAAPTDCRYPTTGISSMPLTFAWSTVAANAMLATPSVIVIR